MQLKTPLFNSKENLKNRTLIEITTSLLELLTVIGQYLMPFNIQSIHATCTSGAPLGHSINPVMWCHAVIKNG